jgi:O-antigen ligase
VGRLLAWAGIALGAAYLIFIGGGWAGVYEARLRIATLSIAGVALMIWGFVAWRDPRWRPRSVLLAAILACLGSLAISTAFSRVPRVSVEYLGYSILLAALYLLLVRLMASPFFRSRVVGLAVILFIGISVEFVAFVVYLWIGWWQSVGHLAIPPLRPNFIGLSWGNPSAVLTIVALFAIPTASHFAGWSRRGIAIFLAIGAVVALVAVLTASRAGWFGLGIAAVVGTVCLLTDRDRRTRLRALIGGIGGSSPSTASRAAIGVAVFVAVAAVVIAVPLVLGRLQAGGEDIRTAYYIAALRMFTSSPIVGTGLGTWVIQRAAYTTSDQSDQYIPHAHDVPVQLLAEQGVVGASAGLFLIVAIIWVLRDAARSQEEGRRRWAWMTVLGLVYLAGHDLLDFYANMPAVLFAAALPLAYLDAQTEHEPRIARLRLRATFSRLPAITAAVLVGVSVAGSLLAEIPVLRENEAVIAANHNLWSDALPIAREAAWLDPEISVYQLTLGLAEDRRGNHGAAAAAFRKVADRDDLPEAWLNLAAEERALGDVGAASNALGRALRLGVQRVEVAMPAGYFALQLGNDNLAVETFAAAMNLSPSLAGDPWWRRDSLAASIREPSFERAVATAPLGAQWALWLSVGDRRHAADAGAQASNPDFARDVVAAWFGDASADQRVLELCVDHPLDLEAILWCGRLQAWLGDDKGAIRFRDQSAAINAGSPAAALTLGVADGPVTGSAPEAAYNWPVYTYRIYGPQDLLVPSLVHVEFKERQDAQ